MAKATPAETKKQQGFQKEKLLQAERYAKRRDLLQALLEEGKTYTLEEVESLINKFMKGKVK